MRAVLFGISVALLLVGCGTSAASTPKGSAQQQVVQHQVTVVPYPTKPPTVVPHVISLSDFTIPDNKHFLKGPSAVRVDGGDFGTKVALFGKVFLDLLMYSRNTNEYGTSWSEGLNHKQWVAEGRISTVSGDIVVLDEYVDYVKVRRPDGVEGYMNAYSLDMKAICYAQGRRLFFNCGTGYYPNDDKPFS